MTDPVRLLVVDDSELFVDVFRSFLKQFPEIKVVGAAYDGIEALQKINSLRPDVITIDLDMPRLDGLSAVERIMRECPTPIIVLTGKTEAEAEAEANGDALSIGALGVRQKPILASKVSREMDELVEFIRAAARVPVVWHVGRDGARSLAPLVQDGLKLEQRVHSPRISVLAAVSSSGGPLLLREIVGRLPQGFPCAVILVQHLSAGHTHHFAEWLSRYTPLDVVVARDNDKMQAGRIYLVEGESHTEVTSDGAFCVRPEEDVRYPGDVLLSSLAASMPTRAVGTVLSGMGRDGAEGLLELKQAGGTTVTQDESAIVDGMPFAARELGAAQHVVSPRELPDFLRKLGERFSDRALESRDPQL